MEIIIFSLLMTLSVIIYPVTKMLAKVWLEDAYITEDKTKQKK